jgi:hypothetical protein
VVTSWNPGYAVRLPGKSSTSWFEVEFTSGLCVFLPKLQVGACPRQIGPIGLIVNGSQALPISKPVSRRNHVDP